MNKLLIMLLSGFVCFNIYANEISLNHFSTMSANVVQTTFTDNNKKTLEQFGTIQIKFPDMLKLTIDNNTLILLGSKATFIEPELEQVTIYQNKNNPYLYLSKLLLSFDCKNLKKYFSVQAIAKRGDLLVYRLTPNKKIGSIDYIEIYIMLNKVQQLDIYNNQGSYNTFKFSNLVFDKEIKDITFKVNIPTNYDIINRS